MTAILGMTLCLLAFVALSLAMPRHYAQVFGGAAGASTRSLLRTSGWLLLAAACAYGVGAEGVGIGLTSWCAWLTAAGLLVAWVLPYRPRWLLPLAATAAVIALSMAVSSAAGLWAQT